MTRSSGEVILPLLTGETSPRVLHPAQQSLVKERRGLAGSSPEENTKMIRRMEHLSMRSGWDKLCCSAWRSKGSSKTFLHPFEREFMKKMGTDFFTKTRDDDFEVKEGRFRLEMRKIYFTMRMVEHWNRLPRGVVDAPLLGTFKVRMDEVWGTWFGWRCPCWLQGHWTRWPINVASNPNYFMILWLPS